MKIETVWSQRQTDGYPTYGVCSTFESDKIFAASGNKVQVIDSAGQIIRVIDTPHTMISCIVAHPTDQKIVTVGIDNQVIFMDTSGTPLFKYGHNTEIQCAAFSPNGQHFLTGADGDIGIYSNGAQRVNKIRTDALVRAVAWSPSSTWFVLATEGGCLIFLDVNGTEFNRCEVGAPCWAMKVVTSAFFKQQMSTAEDEVINNEVEQNEVGVYNVVAKEAKNTANSEFKTNPTAQQFISTNKIDTERLIIVTWDQKYRVINPGSLQHSGVLVEQKRAFSGRRKKLQDQNNPFLMAESRLPFIPLCFELIKQYAVIGGVGGKLLILNAETGAALFDLYQINENDPFILQAPRSSMVKPTAIDQQKYKELAQQQLELRQEHTLSYFGLNNTWIYSMFAIAPNLLVLGLQNGLTLCLRYHFNAVEAVYHNYIAVREGLTTIMVRNVTTGSECVVDVGGYIERVAISASKVVIQSGTRLDVYEIRDQSQQRRHVESVLTQQHGNARRSKISLEFLRQHVVKFRFRQLCVASQHFVLVGTDYVAALGFDGSNATSWKFRDTFVNCCRLAGGISGQENILIGTQDGRALLLKIGNRFPVEAVRHTLPIVQVDVNCHRNLIGVIDSMQNLLVFDYFSGTARQNQEPLYKIQNATSCAFDLVLSNVLSFTVANRIHICIDGSIVYTLTVPFDNAKILIQNGSSNFNVNAIKAVQSYGIHCVDCAEIPMTPNVTHHVKRVFQFLVAGIEAFDYDQELDMAVQAASLGVPVQYWIDIAVASLFAGRIQIAKEALSMIGHVRALKILAEISINQNQNTDFQYVALALTLSNNFADAAMMYAASGDIQTATELLYFTRQDGLLDIGPYTSLIGAITQKKINQLLTEYAQKNNVALGELHSLPNLSLYFKLGSSEEDMRNFRQELLQNQQKQSTQANKYLEYLQIYEQQPIKQGQSINIQQNQYQYQQDFRIMLRRELQALTPQPNLKQEILSKHAKFLEQISDWQAASSSWMDAGECEKAVEVLINNRQTNTLLRLVRILPPINQKKKKDNIFDEEDFDWEVRKDDHLSNTNLIAAFKMVLSYFEQIGDFDSALFIAQRLGDSMALLRLFVSQSMWEQVEDLGKIYPEMLPAIHEARASAFLREGNFMAALERLRLAGNNEKEVAMVRALIDAAVVECKFDMTRSLICQLFSQLTRVHQEGAQYYCALKALRSKILIMSAYIHLMKYVFKHYKSPDPQNLELMQTQLQLQQQTSDPFMITICSFLANYSMLPAELARIDEIYLQKYESMELQDQSANKQTIKETNQFINSQSKPQLGSLSSLDLGNSLRSLPPGIPEQLVWLVLSQTTKQSPKLTFTTMQHLIQMRLPQQLYNNVRKQFLSVKKSAFKEKQDEVIETCCRCGQQLELLQQQVLTQRDMEIVMGLPMCSPALSDVCRKCGTPQVRSAVSLQILPLILIEPDEDSSILELIEKVSSVKIADNNGQIIKIDQEYNSKTILGALREATVAQDGRGVVLPREFYDMVGPTRSFIVNDVSADPKLLKDLAVDGVVKRVFVLTDEQRDVHFCQKCQFFFDADEFEEAYVMGGKCPVCGCEDLLL